MNPPVYCLLVTGKDSQRLEFARKVAIPNFNQQTYPNKFMIIVNHIDSREKVLTKSQRNIHEVLINKQNFTLGDLRNYSMELVPLGALFYTFDDDDTRHPKYLEIMVNALVKEKAIACFMKNRMEYNIKNGYTFKSHFKYGNTHVLCYKIDRLRFMDLDTLEDVRLQDDLASFHKKYVALDNDPRMYIRIIHGSNTSPFATTDRETIRRPNRFSGYSESEATPDEKAYVATIVKKNYSWLV